MNTIPKQIDYTLPIQPIQYYCNFNIKHHGSNIDGGHNYILSGNLPDYMTIKGHILKRENGISSTGLSARNTSIILINNEPKYKLVPTINFTLVSIVLNDSKMISKAVDLKDYFTFTNFDNLTVCLELTSKFNELKMYCNGVECFKYNNNNYILPIENQQYHIPIENSDVVENSGIVEYFLFQYVTFELVDLLTDTDK